MDSEAGLDRQEKESVNSKMKTTQSKNHSVMSGSLQPHGLCSPWNSLGQNTEEGSRSLLQGSSQPRGRTQVSRIAGRFFSSWATRTLECVTYPFSSGSSQPRNQTRVRILYQLSYQRSPNTAMLAVKGRWFKTHCVCWVFKLFQNPETVCLKIKLYSLNEKST